MDATRSSRSFAAGIIALVILAVACGGAAPDDPDPNPEPDPGLPTTSTQPPSASPDIPDSAVGSWSLRSGEVGARPIAVQADAALTLTIEPFGVSGYSGCNSFFGNIVGMQLPFDQLGSTLIACEPAVMEAERLFLQGLGEADRMAVDDDSLVLLGPSSELHFDRVTAGSAGIEGVIWQLDAYCETDFCIPAVAASDLVLDGGSVSGTTGCNTFSGVYRLGQAALETRDLAVTEIGCSPPIMDQERVILGVLNDAPAITVDGQMLSLQAGELSLQYRLGG